MEMPTESARDRSGIKELRCRTWRLALSGLLRQRVWALLRTGLSRSRAHSLELTVLRAVLRASVRMTGAKAAVKNVEASRFASMIASEAGVYEGSCVHRRVCISLVLCIA